MLHVEVVGQRLAVAHEVAYLLCRLHHVLRSLVVGVVQRAVLQQIILKVRGIEFAHKRAVHVERGDAVFLLDIIGGVGIGNVLYIVLQGSQRLALVPLREVFLRRRSDDGAVIVLRARCQRRRGAAEDEDGGEHP